MDTTEKELNTQSEVPTDENRLSDNSQQEDNVNIDDLNELASSDGENANEMIKSLEEKDRQLKGALKGMNEAGHEKNQLWRDIIDLKPERIEELAKKNKKLASEIAQAKWGLSIDDAIENVYSIKKEKGEITAEEEIKYEEKKFDQKVQTGVEAVLRKSRINQFRDDFVKNNREVLEKNPELTKELIQDKKVFENLPEHLQTVDELKRLWSKTYNSYENSIKLENDSKQLIRGEFSRAMGATPRGVGIQYSTKERDYELRKEWESLHSAQKQAGMSPTSYETFLKMKEEGEI